MIFQKRQVLNTIIHEEIFSGKVGPLFDEGTPNYSGEIETAFKALEKEKGYNKFTLKALKDNTFETHFNGNYYAHAYTPAEAVCISLLLKKGYAEDYNELESKIDDRIAVIKK